MTAPVVGILALQGCVKPHARHLLAAGARVVEVRTADELRSVEALIIPGGESTTLLKLISVFGLEAALVARAQEIPYWGICAGAILLAAKVSSPAQHSLGILDLAIERNSYGRQLDSFETDIAGSRVAFIRAPRILTVGAGVEVKANYNGDAVWISQGAHMATTFHPELSPNAPSVMHAEFAARASGGRAQLVEGVIGRDFVSLG